MAESFDTAAMSEMIRSAACLASVAVSERALEFALEVRDAYFLSSSLMRSLAHLPLAQLLSHLLVIIDIFEKI